MIIDRLDNYRNYNFSDDLNAAFDYILTLDADSPEGKTEIKGSDIFAAVDYYSTKAHSEGRLEAHKDYIDIQVMLSGTEIIGWNPIEGLDVSVPYDENKDLMFFNPPDNIAGKVTMTPGMFMVLFPEDGHMPQLIADQSETVHKVVGKIRIK